MRQIMIVLALGLSVVSVSGCQTTSGSEEERPRITRETPLDEAYGYAVTYGDDILRQVRDLARERNELPALKKLSERDLMQKHDSAEPNVLLNAAHLYRISSAQLSPKLLQTLLSSRNKTSRVIGWRMAAVKPSAEVRQTLENYLTQVLGEGQEEQVLIPEMATAVQENNLKSAYTFLVRGLMLEGSPEFANAMLVLDPNRASGPFLDYLRKADLDDLRQMNQNSVNVYTCTVIFRYLQDNPLPINHPGVAQLFTFAISRNRGLADMANAVLEKHMPEHRAALAMILARLPVQVQLAFVENSQREITSNLRLLLSELKDVAQQKEVLEELNSGQSAVSQ